MRLKISFPGVFAKAPAEVAATSTMVCLVPPKRVAEALALEGGLPASELHVTLAYLGKGLDEERVARLLEEIEFTSRLLIPVSAKLSGVGRFSGEGKDAFYVSVDSPDLPELRQIVVTACSVAGAPADMTHGFSPHMTLTYLEADEDSPLRRFGPAPVRFGTLEVWRGAERHRFPLGG